MENLANAIGIGSGLQSAYYSAGFFYLAKAPLRHPAYAVLSAGRMVYGAILAELSQRAAR